MQETNPQDARFAHIADLIVDIAREVRLRGAVDAPGVPLNQTHSQIMRFVHARPGSTASQIAAGAGVKRANVSTAVAELRELGYLVTRRDDSDGRSIRVDPTSLAESTVVRLQAAWGDQLAAAWRAAGANPDQRLDDVVDALDLFAQGLVAGRADTAV